MKERFSPLILASLFGLYFPFAPSFAADAGLAGTSDSAESKEKDAAKKEVDKGEVHTGDSSSDQAAADSKGTESRDSGNNPPEKTDTQVKEPEKKEASEIAPTMSPAIKLVLRNYAFRKQGDYQSAENSLQEAIKVAKSDADKIKVFNAFGGLYMQAGKDKESESYLRQAVALAEKLLPADSTELASYLDNLSVSCGNNKKFADADAFNKRASAIYKAHLNEPNATLDLVKVLDNRGGILLAQKKLSEAEKIYVEAIDLAKNYSQTPPELLACMEDNLGGVYALEGELTKSEESRVNALSLLESSLGFTHPDTIKTQKNLAYVYARQGKYKEAADLLKSAIEKLKKSGNVNSRLLQSCMSDLASVEQLKSDPAMQMTAVQAQIMKGFSALKNADLEGAKRAFDAVIKEHPKEGDAYAGRAVVFRRKHDSVNELADINKAIELSPNTASYYFARAEVHIEGKNHLAAIPDFKKCIELDKTKRISIANFFLGACYVELHKPGEGLPYLNAYIEKTPSDPQAYMARAAAYKMLGKEEEFQNDVKRAQELSAK